MSSESKTVSGSSAPSPSPTPSSSDANNPTTTIFRTLAAASQDPTSRAAQCLTLLATYYEATPDTLPEIPWTHQDLINAGVLQ